MEKIFTTDGACSGNPGPGSYAVCGWEIKDDNLYLTYWSKKSFDHTTNNRMELMGILKVFEIAAADESDNTYTIYSDSAYSVNMLKPNGWIDTWARNGWKNSKKQTVENLDLVQSLYEYRNKIFNKCQLVKVKGHNGDIKNEVTDAIASNNKDKLSKFILNNHIKILKEI